MAWCFPIFDVTNDPNYKKIVYSYEAFLVGQAYQQLLKQHKVNETKFKNGITKQTKVDDLVLPNSLSLKECAKLHEIVALCTP